MVNKCLNCKPLGCNFMIGLAAGGGLQWRFVCLLGKVILRRKWYVHNYFFIQKISSCCLLAVVVGGSEIAHPDGSFSFVPTRFFCAVAGVSRKVLNFCVIACERSRC